MYQEAVQDFQNAVKVDPNHLNAQKYLAGTKQKV